MTLASTSSIAALLFVWGSGTVAAFWHFEGQYLRPVSRPAGAAIAHPESLPTSPYGALETDQGTVRLTGQEPITLLNFWNPSCPCSRFAESDVRRLIRSYQPSGVRFVTVIASGNSETDKREALSAWNSRGIEGTSALADGGNQIAGHFGVWAAPAAVILDNQSRVAYVGSYNAARYCHDPNTAWAEKALTAITHGQKPPRSKTLFFGCQLLNASR